MSFSASEYSNHEITVTYDPKKCTNASLCAKGLSEVFRTSVIPWINLENANSEKIIEQVRKCPSGALSFEYNEVLSGVK